MMQDAGIFGLYELGITTDGDYDEDLAAVRIGEFRAAARLRADLWMAEQGWPIEQDPPAMIELP